MQEWAGEDPVMDGPRVWEQPRYWVACWADQAVVVEVEDSQEAEAGVFLVEVPAEVGNL